jgi:hypothetical protein
MGSGYQVRCLTSAVGLDTDRGIENDGVFTSRRGILSDPVCGTDNVAMTNGNSISGSSGLVKGDSLSGFNEVKENQSRRHIHHFNLSSQNSLNSDSSKGYHHSILSFNSRLARGARKPGIRCSASSSPRNVGYPLDPM